ncbi:hypothetical protein FJ941_05865 [Mesorhizobium sp. B2-3-13]|nr:hypothetical protein FJ941_05865 [Mesorhizobium sp. B2-3-13]
MSRYVAAVFSIVIATQPAMAIEAGVGAKAGNVGVGTSVGVGQNGASIGIGASVGSVGADAGVSVGTGDGSVGASVGASGQLSGQGASSESTPAGAPPGNTPGHPAATTAPAAGVPHISLPRVLRPYGEGGRSSAVTAIEAIPGTPGATVRACRVAIASAASPFGVVSIHATSAGSLRRLSRGAVSAPIAVRIHYKRQGGAEIRQARIRCDLDATGKVIRLT